MRARTQRFPIVRALAGAATAALLAAAALPSPSFADDAAPDLGTPAFSNEVEASLVRAIVGLREIGIRRALGEIDVALAKTPNFRLGHLIQGDLLMARSGNPVAFGPHTVSANASLAPLQDEARVRLKHYLEAPPRSYLPLPMLQMAPGQSHAILVDTARSRLFVFANRDGEPRYVTDFYISQGKNGADKRREGDQRTPLGVYTIVSSKAKLSDFYGSGAFPISYPNEWDKLHKRNGHGIWLHGTPSATYSRPPLATDGCVVLTNEDLRRLSRYVDVGRTPVVISAGIEWVAPDRWEANRRGFLAAFEQWRADWESLDTDRYLSHYSPRFRSEGKDLVAWRAQKRKVNAGKSWVKVGVSDLSVFGNSDGDDMVVVTFAQDYRSSNLSNRTVKRQYWSRDQGRWRVIFETVIS
ncbi:MAG: L,D-transpeptidase family protein [Betaproteobacteria bacterium]|nr:L,D-transpeptidase family protein [Betaproteobacteria bacterium]